jgi:hypothetical protein
MKKIKKAQLGKLIKKGVQEVTKSGAKKEAKKAIPKISDEMMDKSMKKAGREDLKAKMKIWDSEMSSKKKMQAGGVVKSAGKKAPNKKGAFITTQKRTLAKKK